MLNACAVEDNVSERVKIKKHKRPETSTVRRYENVEKTHRQYTRNEKQMKKKNKRTNQATQQQHT